MSSLLDPYQYYDYDFTMTPSSEVNLIEMANYSLFDLFLFVSVSLFLLALFIYTSFYPDWTLRIRKNIERQWVKYRFKKSLKSLENKLNKGEDRRTVYDELLHLFKQFVEQYYNISTRHTTIKEFSALCEKNFGIKASLFFKADVINYGGSTPSEKECRLFFLELNEFV